MEQPNPLTGLTTDEQGVMDHLVAAYNAYMALPHRQPTGDDMTDFRRAIHEAQRILGQRVVARRYPGWTPKE